MPARMATRRAKGPALLTRGTPRPRVVAGSPSSLPRGRAKCPRGGAFRRTPGPIPLSSGGAAPPAGQEAAAVEERGGPLPVGGMDQGTALHPPPLEGQVHVDAIDHVPVIAFPLRTAGHDDAPAPAEGRAVVDAPWQQLINHAVTSRPRIEELRCERHDVGIVLIEAAHDQDLAGRERDR